MFIAGAVHLHQPRDQGVHQEWGDVQECLGGESAGLPAGEGERPGPEEEPLPHSLPPHQEHRGGTGQTQQGVPRENNHTIYLFL